jgi:D-beta-D-heptose 7-phosphate kinase/D-beta-D-heptose 1-phosphate adenosyltransferase
MTKSRVLIIGDVMLDINYNAICNNIANEYPIQVYLIKNVVYRIGGAGNVSLNLKNLIHDIQPVYVSGDDENSKKIQSILNHFEIPNKNFIDTYRTTTTKNRIFIENKIVSRFDQETTTPIS